ncbi:hypothetical protein ACF1GY_08885 [Streptomyces sp. NPDC014684]|uniref:hypothetical protein n=1 Tax=Streptomyces sp. NPDC014684 TaxID=3364880 RepID=UPI0036FCB5BD
MTAESLFSHAGQTVNPSEEKPGRQQLLERERRRRLALIEERNRNGGDRSNGPSVPARGRDAVAEGSVAQHAPLPTPVLPAGYESEERWQEATAAAVRIASAVRGAGHLSGALDGEFQGLAAEGLARAVVEAVRPLPPGEAVRLLSEAQQAGIPVLAGDQAVRARLLLTGLPNQEPPGRVPDEGETESETERAWRLYAASDRLRYSSITAHEQQELVEYLPLPVVDDLIDAGRLTARAVPSEGRPRRLYLQARLSPWDVDQDDLRELGWHSELARRDFYARLTDGDVSVLAQESELTSSQRKLAAALRRVRDSGHVPADLAEKRWLWSALERLAPQNPVNLRRDKTFGPWLLVRRIHRALRLAHQAQLRREEQKYETMLRAAWNDATALQVSWTAAGWEARNALAYLLVLQGTDGPRCEEALDVLSPGPASGIREDRLPGPARHRLESNRDVVRQLARQRDKSHLLNPYLVLGVPDGASDWKSRWRELRCTLDIDGEALVNEAKDGIDALERGRASVPLYALPLMPDRWTQPQAVPSEYRSGALPLPRRSSPPSDAETQFAREGAAAAIIVSACKNVGLPPCDGKAITTSLSESSSE